MSANIEILRHNELPEGGFAGLREHRLVVEPRVFGAGQSGWAGLGNFVYLADARFEPRGDTGLHPHHEIDVITAMVKGRLSHGGSLEDGQYLQAPDVQIQRAGGEGFRHNEGNPDDEWNRLIQLWVTPETEGSAASYHHISPAPGTVTRIYGGIENESPITAATQIDIALLDVGGTADWEGEFLAYLCSGSGSANEVELSEGTLIRGTTGLRFKALAGVYLAVITVA